MQGIDGAVEIPVFIPPVRDPGVGNRACAHAVEWLLCGLHRVLAAPVPCCFRTPDGPSCALRAGGLKADLRAARAE